MMTSLREGFGYPFLECWFANKIVVGRRISDVLDDFEKSGLNFQWLYQKFSIHKKEEKEGLQRTEAIIDILKDNKLREKILKLNKTAVKKQVELLRDKKKQKQIIKANLMKAKNIYEISEVTKSFLKLTNLK